MSKLDISSNYRAPKPWVGANESWAFITPIASMLKVNIAITELNIVNNSLDAKAVGILVPALEDNGANGALSKFTFSGDHHWSKPVTVETGMTELDSSEKRLEVSGAMLLAAWLQHK